MLQSTGKGIFFQSLPQPCDMIILGFRKRMSISTLGAILLSNVSVYQIGLGCHIVNIKVTMKRSKVIFTEGGISINIQVFMFMSLSQFKDIKILQKA